MGYPIGVGGVGNGVPRIWSISSSGVSISDAQGLHYVKMGNSQRINQIYNKMRVKIQYKVPLPRTTFGDTSSCVDIYGDDSVVTLQNDSVIFLFVDTYRNHSYNIVYDYA